MSDEQTKFLLGAYRANGGDAGDPAFAPALAELERDPQLRAWFERDQAFGKTVAGKLREVAPPAGLREAILAGARLGARLPWWRRPSVLALAAGLALLLAMVPLALRMIRPSSSKDLPEFALNFAGRGYIGLQEKNPDVEKLKSWLADRHAPLPAQIPWELAQLHGLGCRTVDFQGKNISLICFEQGHEYHLFVARREDFPTLAPSTEPRFQTRGGSWAAASWSDRDHHYVLVSDAGLDAIKRLL
jgi:hypothetical protein